ncbi:hypothetical protein CXG81DRAFT_24184 [Caulochytrium protostelioides]|uniref:Uncharacterized protein n=1 Tax=Caulochytrium protostelioides TaxID=1555241 RepID=A0A4P9XCK3_9FUNG|nr:hypothetical protein CXG81DRAFT_24184 [Caulochytrium protostelioides]|eukprot:RKP03184.1 hypothetical protein CXG81DRAFT_24184 [Caulochytrium protostelioides]
MPNRGRSSVSQAGDAAFARQLREQRNRTIMCERIHTEIRLQLTYHERWGALLDPRLHAGPAKSPTAAAAPSPSARSHAAAATRASAAASSYGAGGRDAKQAHATQWSFFNVATYPDATYLTSPTVTSLPTTTRVPASTLLASPESPHAAGPSDVSPPAGVPRSRTKAAWSPMTQATTAMAPSPTATATATSSLAAAARRSSAASSPHQDGASRPGMRGEAQPCAGARAPRPSLLRVPIRQDPSGRSRLSRPLVLAAASLPAASLTTAPPPGHVSPLSSRPSSAAAPRGSASGSSRQATAATASYVATHAMAAAHVPRSSDAAAAILAAATAPPPLSIDTSRPSHAAASMPPPSMSSPSPSPSMAVGSSKRRSPQEVYTIPPTSSMQVGWQWSGASLERFGRDIHRG